MDNRILNQDAVCCSIIVLIILVMILWIFKRTKPSASNACGLVLFVFLLFAFVLCNVPNPK